MRIVSLEDDEPFWELLKEALEERFKRIEELLWVRTESEFCEKIPEFAANPPDIFLLDVMVKWADAAENMPDPPKEVKQDGYYRAGLRCRKRLLENPATAPVPAILFTVLERGDIEKVMRELPQGTALVAKSGDFGELIKCIKKLTT
jgi:CheY-like chemotaxis protein